MRIWKQRASYQLSQRVRFIRATSVPACYTDRELSTAHIAEQRPVERREVPVVRSLLFGLALAFAVSLAYPAAAQKQGGSLRIYQRDNPPSASIHEEATISTVAPFMGIF